MTMIKDSYFKAPAPDNNRYFRRNAIAVEIGSYGEKKEPITEANYLAVEGNINFDLLKGKIKKSPPIEVDWSREKKADVEASAKWYFDVGGVKLDFNHKKAVDYRLKLIRFHIDEGSLENLLNNEAGTARENLKKEGKDARVCTSTWVVVSGKMAERFDTSVGLEVSGTTAEGLTITAKGGAKWSGSEKIIFAPGTVFAYGLHKVNKWNGDKVGDTEDDWQGLN
jgi:hypothetical protein